MAARITRAKKKIAAARIPYAVPAADELPARLDAALTVIHLLYTTGHTAPSGDDARPRRADRAGARPRADAAPAAARRARGRRACSRCCSSTRRAARRAPTPAGRLVRLAEQDRSRMGPRADRRGRRPHRRRAARRAARAVPAAGGDRGAARRRPRATRTPTGPRSSTLYDELLRVWPSPVVALNRAVAVAMVDGPEAALAVVEALERDGRLAGYRYLPSTKADLLRRLGRDGEAAAAYRAALALTDNAAEQEFLEGRLQGQGPQRTLRP